MVLINHYKIQINLDLAGLDSLSRTLQPIFLEYSWENLIFHDFAVEEQNQESDRAVPDSRTEEHDCRVY